MKIGFRFCINYQQYLKSVGQTANLGKIMQEQKQQTFTVHSYNPSQTIKNIEHFKPDGKWHTKDLEEKIRKDEPAIVEAFKTYMGQQLDQLVEKNQGKLEEIMSKKGEQNVQLLEKLREISEMSEKKFEKKFGRH